MTFLRRLLSAVVLGVGLAAGIRLGNRGGTPLQRGGWRPLDLPPVDRARDQAPERGRVDDHATRSVTGG